MPETDTLLVRPSSCPNVSSCYKSRQEEVQHRKHLLKWPATRGSRNKHIPHLLAKLKGAGIESIFDLAISIPHQLMERSQKRTF